MGKKCEYRLLGNLSGQVEFMFFYLSGQLSGRYCPETGQDWKKPAKIGLFLEVFANIHTVLYGVFIPNFKRR